MASLARSWMCARALLLLLLLLLLRRRRRRARCAAPPSPTPPRPAPSALASAVLPTAQERVVLERAARRTPIHAAGAGARAVVGGPKRGRRRQRCRGEGGARGGWVAAAAGGVRRGGVVRRAGGLSGGGVGPDADDGVVAEGAGGDEAQPGVARHRHHRVPVPLQLLHHLPGHPHAHPRPHPTSQTPTHFIAAPPSLPPGSKAQHATAAPTRPCGRRGPGSQFGRCERGRSAGRARPLRLGRGGGAAAAEGRRGGVSGAAQARQGRRRREGRAAAEVGGGGCSVWKPRMQTEQTGTVGRARTAAAAGGVGWGVGGGR